MNALFAAIATSLESIAFLGCWWGVSTYLIDHQLGAFLVTLLVWVFCSYAPKGSGK